MIALPRAALRAKDIAKHADFFSFGTNDLTRMKYITDSFIYFFLVGQAGWWAGGPAGWWAGWLACSLARARLLAGWPARWLVG